MSDHCDIIAPNTLFIFTDIESDSIEAKLLLQISAVSQHNDQFNVFVNPQRPLALSVTNFLNLYYYNGDLYRNGLKLNAKPIIEALNAFMVWIKKQEKPTILICHNGFAFDSVVLTNRLHYFNINIPENLKAIGDTLPLFRKTIKAPEIENHKLSTLAKYFNIEQLHAHDGLDDSITLKHICEKYAEKFNTNYLQMFEYHTRKLDDYMTMHRTGIALPKMKKEKTVKTKKKKDQKDKIADSAPADEK